MLSLPTESTAWPSAPFLRLQDLSSLEVSRSTSQPSPFFLSSRGERTSSHPSHSGPVSPACPLLIFSPFTLYGLLRFLTQQPSNPCPSRKCPFPGPSSSAPTLNNNLRTMCPPGALLPPTFTLCPVRRDLCPHHHPKKLLRRKLSTGCPERQQMHFHSYSFGISSSLLQCLKYFQGSILTPLFPLESHPTDSQSPS